jgi:hypothetical protein
LGEEAQRSSHRTCRDAGQELCGFPQLSSRVQYSVVYRDAALDVAPLFFSVRHPPSTIHIHITSTSTFPTHVHRSIQFKSLDILNCGALLYTPHFVPPSRERTIASREFSHSGSGKAPESLQGAPIPEPVAVASAHQETRLKTHLPNGERRTTLPPSSHYCTLLNLSSSSVFRPSLCPLLPSLSSTRLRRLMARVCVSGPECSLE